MWKTFQSNLQIAIPCKTLVQMFCVEFRNFVALVSSTSCGKALEQAGSIFLLLCPLLPDVTQRYCPLYFPKFLSHLPVAPCRHPFKPFPAFSAPQTVTPCKPTTIHFCSQMQKYPTVTNNQKAPVTSVFRGWCSIVSLLKSCHCGKTLSIVPFACQDWASHIKISQITYFSCVFPGKKTLAHGCESKA